MTRVAPLATCGRVLVGAALLTLSRATFAQDAPPPVDYPPVAQEPAPAPPVAQDPANAPPPEGYPPGVQEPVPPLAPEEHHGFKMPPWSVRIDPFTWLIEGRLGIELEAGILKWLSVELVPVFVTSTTPPTLSSFSSRDSGVEQHSNGLGPISGTSLGAGFWLGGHVLHGYVLRVIYTNYGYTYTTHDGGEVDRFSHTDRWLMGMIGSNATWGPFTLGGGIGLGVDLNKQSRCYPDGATSKADAQGSGCSGWEIALDRGFSRFGNVAPAFYPVVLAGRISLGVTFD
ncbi:MAG TPA: hypothetical protein VH062_10705 [Polyangiaceae bacterium]|jgi:hypothetical protein|nr:hypothetical protein [Polyangiaceae bacterium]